MPRAHVAARGRGRPGAGAFLLPAPPAGGFRVVERRRYPGLTELTLVVYEPG